MRLDLGDILLDAAMEVESTVGIEPAGDAPPLWTPLPPQPGRGIMLPDGRVLSPQQLAVETPADETFFGGGGGGGKALDVDTPIATPNGWKRLGDIKVGDCVFGFNGQPVHVLAVTEEMIGRPTYCVAFDDGDSIVADADHLWRTHDASDRKALARESLEFSAARKRHRTSRVSGNKSAKFTASLQERNRTRIYTPVRRDVLGYIRTTQQIAAKVKVKHDRETNHSIVLPAAPLAIPAADTWPLPIDPYVLGVWLGDGTSLAGVITTQDKEIVDFIRASHHEVWQSSRSEGGLYWRVGGLQKALRDSGLLGNKHVPDRYLWSAPTDRLALLQGLMDTDGWVDTDGGASFCNTNERLVDAVVFLMRSFGLKAFKTAGRATFNGKDCGDVWTVKATASFPFCRLSRKQQRIKSVVRATQRRRYIVAVDTCESRPVRCIQVDAADGMFLAGKSLTPTHNSHLLLGLAATRHRNSIIFRREFTQFRGAEGLIQQSINLIGDERLYNRSLFTWRKIGGFRSLEFGAAKTTADMRKYRGRPHDLKCVAPETPVLLADGSYCAAENLAVGDFVATLEGPQRVTRTMRLRREAVRFDVLDWDGRPIWSQVQGANHELLTSDGWVSHDKLFDVRRGLHAASSSTRSRDAYRSTGSSLPQHEAEQLVLAGAPFRQSLRPEQQPGRQQAGSLGQSDLFVVSAEQGLETCSGVSGRQRRDVAPRSLLTGAPEPPRPARALVLRETAPGRRHRGVVGDPRSALPAGSPARYSTGSRRDDERSLLWSKVVLALLPRRDGAVLQIPISSRDDGQARIRIRSRPLRQYVHPYTSEQRPTTASASYMAARSYAVGVRDLVDVTVESCRHYITGPGVVNRNCFDELPEFPEEVYRFLIGWLRTSHAGQRTRVVSTGNPPVDDSSQWIKDYWAPWLRKGHPNPAQQGELRWYVSDAKGKDIEVPGPKWGNERAEAVIVNGKAVLPRSRTFIQSVVEDNPIYMETGYAAVLDSLPEPYRSSMRHGDFTASTPDDERQVIPTAWVVAAQDRWTADGGRGPLSMVGNDPSRGGQDEFVIAKRYDDWVAPLVIHAASEAPDGPTGALLVYRAMDGDRKDVPVQVDVIGSAGSSVYDHAKSLGLQVVALNGAEASSARDRSGKLGFVNKRAEWYWKMRELLDPAYGATLALPPDPQLRADLCAPRWSYRTRVQIEPKDDIKARIGRSPDRGEAVMYACVLGDARGAFGLLFDAASTDDVKALEDEVAELERRLSGRSA